MTELHDHINGLSRRELLNRSAATLGIALAGNLEGLFGDAVTQAAAHGQSLGYGPLITLSLIHI